MAWINKEEEKAYNKEYHKKRYAEKKEQILSQNKIWRDANKDKMSELKKSWREDNRGRDIENSKRWRDANPEVYKESKRRSRVKNLDKCREYDQAWRDSNRDHVRARSCKYLKDRLKSNPQFKIAWYTRVRMRNVLKGIRKSAAMSELLGCSLDFARSHIESQFRPGMSWDNWAEDGWHLDHIRPLASFDLTDSGQQHEAFRYTNLQPLWWYENLEKGAKLLTSTPSPATINP